MNINIIQTYDQTANKHENEIESWYNEIKEILRPTNKTHMNNINNGRYEYTGQREGGVENLVELEERNDR